MQLMTSGPLPLRLLDAAGAVVKTLYLPCPSRDGLQLEWIEKTVTHELENGSERTKVRGYLPQLTVTWSVYNDNPGQGYQIGTLDGQMPTWDQLLDILSTWRVRIGTGLSTGLGLTAGRVQVGASGLAGRSWASKCKITFRAADARTTRNLEAF